MVPDSLFRPAVASRPIRVLFALPGIHRVVRGAEVAFEELGRALSRMSDFSVTLAGSGPARSSESYRYIRIPSVPRERFERWPGLPCLRNHYMYEELTFAPGLVRAYQPSDYDITVTCSYPYTNWILRARRSQGRRPHHVFVTQNGDWMVQARNAEYRWFGCDGLVCTNPEYYERHCSRWPSALIPNGVDPEVFSPGLPRHAEFGLPPDVPLVLMVSALIPSKRVLEGVRAIARLRGVGLVVAGDGELRGQVAELGHRLMPGRFWRLQLPRSRMPDIYRSASVFLHMSKDEPSANAYIEALATGLPIVTHDRVVTRWTLENCAFLVNTDRLEDVAHAVIQAMMTQSPEVAGASRRLVDRRFAWSAIARAYGDFFRGLLCSNRVGKQSRDGAAVAAGPFGR